MKLKAILLIFLAVMACAKQSFGQQIDNIVFLPSSPDTNDFFSVDVYTVHSSTECFLVDTLTEISINNDTINIKATHSYGVMPAGCLSNDTFDIGVLAAGTYFLHFELHIYEFNPSLQDIKDTMVTVVPATSIKENTNDVSIINLFPNPFSETVTVGIKTANDNFPLSFKLFNPLGRVVMEIMNVRNEKFEVNRQGLSSGIYFYQIKDNKSNFVNGKVVIQ